MNLNLSDEQQLLLNSVSRLFSVESSPARVRAAEASGFDAELWQQLVDFGITTMRIPASAGGSGMGLLEALLIAEEAGRHLVSVPLAESLPAARLLAQLDSPAAIALLDQAKQGELITLAPMPYGAGRSIALPGANAAVAVLVRHGDAILALTDLTAKPPSANLGSDSLQIWAADDRTVASHVIDSGSEACRAFEQAVEEWKLLKAAMLMGLAHQALKLAAAYSCERQQFGRAIGGFQGIAHPLADALTEIEGGQLLVRHAVWSIAQQQPDAAARVSMAWWWATQSSARAVARALHTFGGYGVSLEYDVQLYYRRAKAWGF